MRVTVRLYATLEKYQPHRGMEEFPLELPDGALVRQCVQTLGIPEKESYLAIVNGSQVSRGHPLQDGDRLALFPPIAGG